MDNEERAYAIEGASAAFVSQLRTLPVICGPDGMDIPRGETALFPEDMREVWKDLGKAEKTD